MRFGGSGLGPMFAFRGSGSGLWGCGVDVGDVGFGLRVSGFGFRVSGVWGLGQDVGDVDFGFWVSNIAYQVGCEFRRSGLG